MAQSDREPPPFTFNRLRLLVPQLVKLPHEPLGTALEGFGGSPSPSQRGLPPSLDSPAGYVKLDVTDD